MKTWTLTSKLAATWLTFLLLALSSIGITLWVTWTLEGGAAAINEAGRLRMQTYRLALLLSTGGDGPAARQQAAAFDNSLSLLRTGDPSRPLFVPWSADTEARLAEVEAGWLSVRGSWLAQPPPTQVGREAEGLVAKVDGLVHAVEAEIARSTAALRAFQLAMMGLAIASAVVLLYTGHLLVLSPLARLQRGLAGLQQGDLSMRMEVNKPDEFGALSAGFNSMAQALQSLYGTLEEKVREKTERLELKQRRLADLYEVSAFLAEAPTLEVLGRGFVRHIRRIAAADAASVRWCGDPDQRYLMLAHDGLPPAFVADEACVETGSCHCGQAAAVAATRVIPISPERPAPMDHCARAGFATVIAVPVRLHDKVLAEVNLFFRGPATLEDGERSLLETLGAHLASAIESLRASAMEREAAVAEERGLLARELHDSIAQALAFMKIEMQLLRQATQRGDAAATQRVIGELDAGVRECNADVRELLLHFRTRASPEDIGAALRVTLQKFEHQTGLPARLVVQGHGLPLPADVQVQVLHIVQEALSNVRKHARATQVELQVTTAPCWRFEVHDDGVGIDPAGTPPDETHVGLRIMQERAAMIGARVTVGTSAHGGCRVTLELPAAREVPSTAEPVEALA